MPVPRVTITGSYRFLLADIRAVFGTAVPAHPFLVEDAGRDIEPHDGVARTMRLGCGLGVELRDLTRRGDGRGCSLRVYAEWIRKQRRSQEGCSNKTPEHRDTLWRLLLAVLWDSPSYCAPRIGALQKGDSASVASVASVRGLLTENTPFMSRLPPTEATEATEADYTETVPTQSAKRDAQLAIAESKSVRLAGRP